MTDLVPTFHGEMMLAGWKDSHKSGPMVSFFLPDSDDLDVFKGMTAKKGKTAGQRFMCVLVEIADDETPAAPPAPAKAETKPFGKEAAELYRVGFFFNQKVMEKVGTDEQFLEWLKTQPCCIPFKKEWLDGGMAKVDKPFHEGDIVPAHVRRIAAGAGTLIKPPYSAVPMCNGHHSDQHQHGESMVGGKEFLDMQRARHLSRWMAETAFNQKSMGFVDPVVLRAWANNRDIGHYLPEVYR